MFNNFSSFGGFAMWHGLIGLFCLAFLVGFILIMAWAIKTLKKEQLLKWSISLIIISILGWFISMSFGGFGPSMFSGRYGYGMMNSDIWNCAQNKECYDDMGQLMQKMIGIRNN